MNGTQIKFSDYVRIGQTAVGRPDASWHILGTADFDGDGQSDILWRTDSGAMDVWEMNGAQIKAADYLRIGQSAVGAPGADWQVLGTADFDGDGKADLLWRTDSGDLAIWEMNGTQIKAADYLRIGQSAVWAPGADWHIVGTTDFDGDGKADLLWRTDSGALAIWEMNGTQVKATDYIRIGQSVIGVPGPDWHIVSTGDYDGDGKGDILWRTDGGWLAVWNMTGMQIKSADYVKIGQNVVGAPGVDWNIIHHEYALPVILDLDGNGVDVTPLGASAASFDMNGDGAREHTAWAGRNDGILAIDLDGSGDAGPDGVIDQTKEIIFSAWVPGTTSDMAALRQVFDTNHNGVLDAGDARWSEFRVWQDADGDGVSRPDEVKTLEQLGIASIDLNPNGPATTFGDGSTIQGLSIYTRVDGTTGAAGDVSLAYEADTSLSQLIQAMAMYSTASSGLGAGSIVGSANDPSQQGMVAASWHP
jgi:hypothetical protein